MTDFSPRKRKTAITLLILILAAAFAARLVPALMAAGFPERITRPDTPTYLEPAKALCAGEFSGTGRAPGYIWLAAGARARVPDGEEAATGVLIRGASSWWWVESGVGAARAPARDSAGVVAVSRNPGGSPGFEVVGGRRSPAVIFRAGPARPGFQSLGACSRRSPGCSCSPK